MGHYAEPGTSRGAVNTVNTEETSGSCLQDVTVRERDQNTALKVQSTGTLYSGLGNRGCSSLLRRVPEGFSEEATLS